MCWAVTPPWLQCPVPTLPHPAPAPDQHFWQSCTCICGHKHTGTCPITGELSSPLELYPPCASFLFMSTVYLLIVHLPLSPTYRWCAHRGLPQDCASVRAPGLPTAFRLGPAVEPSTLRPQGCVLSQGRAAGVSCTGAVQPDQEGEAFGTVPYSCARLGRSWFAARAAVAVLSYWQPLAYSCGLPLIGGCCLSTQCTPSASCTNCGNPLLPTAAACCYLLLIAAAASPECIP
jgi:hypothetical protein